MFREYFLRMKLMQFFLILGMVLMNAGAAQAQDNLPPDTSCNYYQGTICVSPVTLPPDATCNVYQGGICVSPVISLPPDQTCSYYQGNMCLAPILHMAMDPGSF